MATYLLTLDYDPTRSWLLRTTAQTLAPTYPPQPQVIPATHLEFVQATPSGLWIWNHNLGYRPVPEIMDLAGNRIIGQVEQPTTDQIRVIFNPPQTGRIVI
jgi:hypothetical protein